MFHSNRGGMTPMTVHGRAVEHQRPPEHARVGTERAHPRAVAHHRDRRRVRRRVRGVEHAAEHRFDAQEVEAVRRHPGDVEALGAVVALPVHRVAAGADDVLERGGLLLIVEELLGGEVGAAELPIRGVAQDDVHQAIGTRVRKRIQRRRCAGRCR